ncbi:MAG: ribose 5-phosphate isomerase B [Caldiserica bacterium]|nr:MAG: ribose 5-phosphate isomerase B [Caldisericota bacterium]
MRIAIGSDHAGFDLKEELKKFLEKEGYEVKDFGCYSKDSVDYPDIALLLCEAVRKGECEKGILLDGTGGGMTMTANKIKGIRAVCVYNEMTARYASEHDDCNVLCIGAKMVGDLLAKEMVKLWLTTPFGGGRHERRLNKVKRIEEMY